MGTTITPSLTTSGTVTPGTTVIQSVYTDTGFTAGDYVYRYGTGSVGSAPNTASSYIYNITVPIAGTPTSVGYGAITVARSNFTGPQTGPSTGTFSGTSSSLGSTFQAETLVSNTAASNGYTADGTACATLTNGNIVFVYATSSSVLLYIVQTPTGGAVANGTVTSSTYSRTGTYSRSFDVCALYSGGFAVAWASGGSSVYTSTYTAAGVVVRSSTAASISVSAYYPRIVSNPAGYLFVSTTTSTTAGGTGYISAIDPTGLYVTKLVIPNGASYQGSISIAMTVGGSIAWAGNVPSNIYYFGMFSFSQTVSTFTSLGSTSGGSPPSANQNDPPQPVPTVNGGACFVIPDYNNNQMYAYFYTSGFSQIASNSISPTSNYNICLAAPYWGAASIPTTIYTPNSNSAVAIIDNASSIRIYLFNLTGTTVTISAPNGTATNIPYYSNSWSYSATQSLSAGTIVTYLKSSDSKPYFQSVGNFTLTNGSSYSIPTTFSSITPTYGYYLLGIAMTTASSGAYGDVMINGTANLSTSYATSSTPIGFNYNAANNANLFSNRGYVVNRTVTLQGLE